MKWKTLLNGANRMKKATKNSRLKWLSESNLFGVQLGCKFLLFQKTQYIDKITINKHNILWFLEIKIIILAAVNRSVDSSSLPGAAK